MDWSENNSCIKCDKSGNLLVCSENGCPLALHEKCLGFPARLDDEGRFYCPYCLYKKAVAELQRARDCASAGKKALLIFMDEKPVSDEKDMEVNKTCEDNGHNQSKTSDKFVCITSCGDDKSNSNNNGNINQPLSLGEAEKMEEDSEDSASNKAEDASLDRTGDNGNRTAEEKQVHEEEHETSGDEQIHEEECETFREEQIQEKEHETSEGKQIEEEESETFVEESIQEEEHEPFGEKHVQEGGHETSGEERVQEKEHKTSGEKHTEEEECDISVEEQIQEGQLETFGEKHTEEEERDISVEEQIQEGQFETSVEEEEEKICEEEPEASSASMEQDHSPPTTPKGKRPSNRSKPVDKDSEAVPMQSEPLKNNGKKKQASPAMTPTRKSARRSLPDSKMVKEVKKEFVSPKSLMKPAKPSSRPASTSNVIRSPKRKRLMWTEEEEEALRKGVKKYAKEANVKMPWRKILESSNKFDPTRNPADLKDKWRNMTGR